MAMCWGVLCLALTSLCTALPIHLFVIEGTGMDVPLLAMCWAQGGYGDHTRELVADLWVDQRRLGMNSAADPGVADLC